MNQFIKRQKLLQIGLSISFEVVFQNQNLSIALSDTLNKIVFFVKESLNETAAEIKVVGLMEPKININFEYTGMKKFIKRKEM